MFAYCLLNKKYVYSIKWLSLLLIAKKKYDTYYDEPIIIMCELYYDYS